MFKVNNKNTRKRHWRKWLSVNHFAKSIHHYHHHHRILILFSKTCNDSTMLFLPDWLSLCASSSFFFWNVASNIILFDFNRVLFRFIVNLSRIVSHFVSFDKVLGIHFSSNFEITGSSSICFAINDIPRWCMTGVVCNV